MTFLAGTHFLSPVPSFILNHATVLPQGVSDGEKRESTAINELFD